MVAHKPMGDIKVGIALNVPLDLNWHAFLCVYLHITVIRTFHHTDINSFSLPVHAAGNLIYTCKGHIRFSDPITLSPRPHLEVSLDLIWYLQGSHSSDWLEMISLPPFRICYWFFSLFPLLFTDCGWLPKQCQEPLLEAPCDVYVEGIRAPSFIWFHLDECHSVQQTMASPRHNTTLLPFKKSISERE